MSDDPLPSGTTTIHTFVDVESALARVSSIEQGAFELAEMIRVASRRRWVGIYRVTPIQVINLGWSGPAAPAHPVFATGDGLTGAAIASCASVCSNDTAADPRYLTNQATTGSELIVPILLDGAVVGTLDIEEGSPNAFTSEDVMLFGELAARLAPLYRETA
jgi:putative methionine-R-sulfoxide reductase with GAF domain